MVAFEIITIGIAAAGLGACALPYFRPMRAASELGRQGQTWFDHADEQEIAERPAEDAVDGQIRFRPLRSRRG
jgi:hypothetical protein